MKVRKGFCCYEFEEAYRHGIEPIGKAPGRLALDTEREYCTFCGKDPNKYLKDKEE